MQICSYSHKDYYNDYNIYGALLKDLLKVA